MNNHGKIQGLFVLLIPVILIITIVIIDTLISYSENKRYKDFTEKAISEVMNNNNIEYEDYYNELKKIYERNNYNTDMLVVDASEYNVYIENEHNYFNIFTSLKKGNDKQKIKILGATFKVNKNSKLFIKVDAKKIEDKIEFEYTK